MMLDARIGMTDHGTLGPSGRRSRADLHIHSDLSDGTASISAILAHVQDHTDLAAIAITDHDRIDGALRARSMAVDQGLNFEVVIGQEVSTRGGHLLGLFIETPIARNRSLRDSVAAIHDAGGLAVPAHPLVPYPQSAQGFMLRALLADPDPRFWPDALETFNPTVIGRASHARTARFALGHGLAGIGSSDAHALRVIGAGWTSYPGASARDLRAAILAGTTRAHGDFHGVRLQLGIFGAQLAKRGRGVRSRSALTGHVRR